MTYTKTYNTSAELGVSLVSEVSQNRMKIEKRTLEKYGYARFSCNSIFQNTIIVLRVLHVKLF